jgi:hypothetical protein
MKRIIPSAMIVIGIGLAVFAFSDYTPASAGSFAGWSDSCRYAMTLGAMPATGARLLFVSHQV